MSASLYLSTDNDIFGVCRSGRILAPLQRVNMKPTALLSTILVNLIILFVMLEAGGWAYMSLRHPKLGYLSVLPTYLDFAGEDRYEPDYDPLGPHVIDSAYPWSTWHPRNSTHRHRKPCFDVIMKFNAEGTRGDLPDPSDSNTAIFVGDSFTEGYGLPEDSTLPALYGRATGAPVLNLGAAGYLGTTMYSLVYEHFAERYRHRRLYVILFLANDLFENDIREYDGFFSGEGRYRPYRNDTSRLDSIVYKGSLETTQYTWKHFREVRANGKPQLERMGMRHYWKEWDASILSKLYHLTYTSRLSKVVQDALKKPDTPAELEHDEWDLRIFEHDIRKIMGTATRHGVSVTFLNLPSLKLMKLARSEVSFHERYLALEDRIARTVGTGPHRYLSYYRHLRASDVDPNSLVFSCDGHYSEKGIERLTRFVLSNR